jgi:excisionase family DNA binding protein
VFNPILGDKYGLAMTSFILENVSVPPEVEQAIDKRSSMAAVGNLNDYVKYQMGQGMEKGGSGGAGGVAAEMAVGMAMAQQMMNQSGGLMAQTTKGIESPSAPPNGGGLELMNPAQVAQMLGVGESDVVASLESGDLKGKKIGTQWRVPKSAVEAFIKS